MSSRQPIRHGWLLWAATGTTATMNAYRYPPLLSTAVGSFVCLIWILYNVSTRMLICNFLSGCVDIFFRQVAVAGAHKLNASDCPLLVAIAPDSNQFIDPMIVLKTFERNIGFLCAAKSMRFKGGPADIVASLARGLDCVPVERGTSPRRRRKLAKAAATADGGAVHVHGSGTAFVKQVKPGDQLLVSAGPCKGALAKVADVVSDELLVCAAPAFRGSDANPDATAADVKDAAFKVMPKVDQHDMYDAIYDALDDNGVIGIFPEGGSHDRSSLLPLKAGIAVMALGACAKHGEALRSRLRIAAVGLNYFSGHKFRSRVFVDYGEPFEVSRDLVDRYLGGDKRGAGDALMAEILTAVKAVTVQAPSSDMAEIFWMLRRLYVPDGKRLTLEEKVALTRGFAASVLLGGADDDVVDRFDALAILGLRVTILFAYSLAIFPGLLLASPLLVFTDAISRHKAKVALAGSRVKLRGNDVLATWKVLCGMILIPALHLTYTAVVHALYGFPEAVLYFFFMPFVSATSIYASESFLSVASSIGPL
ncbi:glycerone-phosphate O-acyltransferase [Aureococcus anophagefferens]|nr:glycerone-phosphate O-acyltransferase [Aureococcus anophagefferens]